MGEAFAAFDYRLAVKLILEIGHAANQFLTQHEPWKVLATDAKKARGALSEAAEIIYLLTALIDPIVPELANRLATQLNRPKLTFQTLETAGYPLLDRSLQTGEPSPLINRIEETQVSKLIQPMVPVESPPEVKVATPEIEFDDFAKVLLRVGKVVAAEKVPKADKLLKLTVDLGEGSARTIVSGIAEAYSPEQVQGRSVVVVTNLKPRMLRGIESRGMILTAGKGGSDLTLIDPGTAAPGSEVK